MPIATIAIDLAKDVFELAAADETGKIVERRRLSRLQLERYFENRRQVHVVTEACGTAHYWARKFGERDMRVSLLPPHYVRAYVRRNKTDTADATALLLYWKPHVPATGFRMRSHVAIWRLRNGVLLSLKKVDRLTA